MRTEDFKTHVKTIPNIYPKIDAEAMLEIVMPKLVKKHKWIRRGTQNDENIQSCMPKIMLEFDESKIKVGEGLASPCQMSGDLWLMPSSLTRPPPRRGAADPKVS